MRYVIEGWMMLFHGLFTPCKFSSFEDMKEPEHYEQEWFYKRNRRENHDDYQPQR